MVRQIIFMIFTVDLVVILAQTETTPKTEIQSPHKEHLLEIKMI